MVLVVSVEADIAGGKSTIINEIITRKQDENSNVIFILVQEPVDKWKKIMVGNKDILTEFYDNMKETALPFQLIALLTRKTLFEQKMKEAKEIETSSGKTVILVTERTINSDRHIFAKMLHKAGFISESGIVAYNLWNDNFSGGFHVDKILYLTTPPEICYQRVLSRDRPGEEGITLDYLKKCQEAHDSFYKDVISKHDHMVIDTSDILTGTPEYDDLVNSVIEYFSRPVVESV